MGGYPRIRILAELKEPVQNSASVRLIRSGEVVETFSGSLPIDIDFVDRYYEPGKKIYYRIDVESHGLVVSNPIFVTFASPPSI